MKLDTFSWTPESGWNRPLSASPLASTAQLVLVFGQTRDLVGLGGVAALRRIFPSAHVVGCTTGGEIHGTEVRDDTLALTALTLEHGRVAVTSVNFAGDEECRTAGRNLVRQLDPSGLRHVFVVSEGVAVDSSDLVRGLAEALPTGVTMTGGFAGDGNRLRHTEIWCDGEPRPGAAAAIGFYGERLRVGVATTGGWGPFGPDRIITRSRKNVLYEFDGRPALALYKQYLGPHADALPVSGLMFPLELRVAAGGNRVLRALLGIDDKEQSITFAGDVPEGSSARFMVGHIEDLIDGTFQAARQSWQESVGAAPQLSLVVSCNARRSVLKQRVDEEMEAVREVLGPTPVLTGFYSYGEVAPPLGGGLPELHNETMTITNFVEL